jgi:predicted DNA-binding transcriptional regulator AlpA
MSQKINAVHTALSSFHALPDEAYVRLPVVAALYGCSTATVWRRVKEGHIDSPRKLGARTTCWNVGQLRKALAHVNG